MISKLILKLYDMLYANLVFHFWLVFCHNLEAHHLSPLNFWYCILMWNIIGLTSSPHTHFVKTISCERHQFKGHFWWSKVQPSLYLYVAESYTLSMIIRSVVCSSFLLLSWLPRNVKIQRYHLIYLSHVKKIYESHFEHILNM